MTSSTDAEISAGYELLLGDGGTVLSERDIVRVSGPDAARYLQGQLSQDVVAMTGESAWSFLLAPTGKVEAWLRVHRLHSDDYVLETDAGWGSAVVARLQRFLLRTKAEIAAPETKVLRQTRWDPSLIRFDAEESEGSIVCTPVGPGVAGVDELVLRDATAHDLMDRSDMVPDASYERYRIAHGIVRMGRELTEQTIPGEAGAWIIDASVSFTKGCYTGQELVARIDSRGNNVPHPIRVLSLDAPCEVGDEVILDDTVVGVLTSVVPPMGERPGLALGRVGRSVVEGVSVSVGLGRTGATVVAPGTVR